MHLIGLWGHIRQKRLRATAVCLLNVSLVYARDWKSEHMAMNFLHQTYYILFIFPFVFLLCLFFVNIVYRVSNFNGKLFLIMEVQSVK